MIIRAEDFAEQGILAGVDSGRAVFGKMLALVAKDPSEPELLILDFTGVSVATASFLRESALGLRGVIRQRKSNYYLVIANTNPVVMDEFLVLTKAMGIAIYTCSLDESGCSQMLLLGELELKQRQTLELVEERGETDAAELMRTKDEGVGQTAWNNRLSSLVQMGLIAEVSVGRAKRYRSLKVEW